jgi:uncharacterized membrane protein YfcA
LDLHRAIFIFFAGMLGACLNSVAGGGSFIGFPALLFAGVPPIPANVTNNIAMLMGMVASGGAYRSRLDVSKRVLAPLVIASLTGGLVGALLLLKTPAHTFMRAIPWFMLFATLLFIFGRRMTRTRHLTVSHEAPLAAIAVTSLLQFFLAIYGGYFGAGMSIVVLAMLAAAGMADIHAMNALKSVLGVAVNGIAAFYFVFSGTVYWPQAGIMTLGALLGGYLGAHVAQRLPQAWARTFVILVGSGMTVYFFMKAY